MTATDGALEKPLVSVILPMNDHRGIATEAVASWVCAQTCDHRLFEVVVILDDSTRSLETALRPLLRSHDLLLTVGSSDEISQYDLGARAARGEYLFFTEPHCLARPSTVAETIGYFASSPVEGFCAASSPICRNRLAALEWRMFEEGWRTWSQEGHWCKVILRGFAIRRGVYLEAGGFEVRYGRFAEWLLSATLHARGHRLGCAPRVFVEHVYGTRLALFDAFIREFTEGECLLRTERSAEFCERYFGLPQEWEEIQNAGLPVVPLLRRALARQLGVRHGCTSTWRGRFAVLGAMLRLLAAPFLGTRSARAWYAVAVWAAKVRCCLWRLDSERMYLAFKDYWERSTVLCRIRYLQQHGPRLPKTALVPQTCYAMEHLPREWLYGFHNLEQHRGRWFRWSSRVAALRVSLAPGRYLATIRLLGVRSLAPTRELALYFNATPLRDVEYDARSASLRFQVPANATVTEAAHWLIILCEPWRSSRRGGADVRLLGLPVLHVGFERRDEGESRDQ